MTIEDFFINSEEIERYFVKKNWCSERGTAHPERPIQLSLFFSRERKQFDNLTIIGATIFFNVDEFQYLTITLRCCQIFSEKQKFISFLLEET